MLNTVPSNRVTWPSVVISLGGQANSSSVRSIHVWPRNLLGWTQDGGFVSGMLCSSIQDLISRIWQSQFQGFPCKLSSLSEWRDWTTRPLRILLQMRMTVRTKNLYHYNDYMSWKLRMLLKGDLINSVSSLSKSTLNCLKLYDFSIFWKHHDDYNP